MRPYSQEFVTASEIEDLVQGQELTMTEQIVFGLLFASDR